MSETPTDNTVLFVVIGLVIMCVLCIAVLIVVVRKEEKKEKKTTQMEGDIEMVDRRRRRASGAKKVEGKTMTTSLHPSSTATAVTAITLMMEGKTNKIAARRSKHGHRTIDEKLVQMKIKRKKVLARKSVRKGRFKNAQHIAGSGWKTNALREKPKKIQSDKWKTNSLSKEPEIYQSGKWKTNSLSSALGEKNVLPEGWASAVNEDGHV